MGKRNQQRKNPAPPGGHLGTAAAAVEKATLSPAKNPTLLAVSIALYALWFAFLLVTALVG